MRCSIHGDLPADWSSCPYCLRGANRSSGQYQTGGLPPNPTFRGYGMDDTARTRGAAGADATRGAGVAPAGADVTRGAGAADAPFGVYSAGKTRIVDAPPSKRKIRAWLIEKEGPRPDQLWQIGDDVTWIGRDRRNQICIDDDTISTQHIKLWVDDDRTLRMLNVSTSNGTRVNGVRVEAPVALVENDEIQLGSVVLVLKRLDAPLRAAAPSYEPAGYAAPVAAPPVYTPSAYAPPSPFGGGAPAGGSLPHLEPTVPPRATEYAEQPATERVPDADPTLWLEERRTP